MEIAIKGTNLNLTPEINNYIKSRLSGIDKFIKKEGAICHVEVSKTTNHHKQGDVFRAEIRVTINGKEYYLSSERTDLYGALDEVKEGLFNDITYDKEKRTTFIRRSGAKVKNMLKGIFNK
jgi:ribosomal subunit interface protein